MPTDPRATYRQLFKEGSTYPSTTTLNAALESGSSNFKWDSRYEAIGYETWTPLETLIFPSPGLNYDGIFNIVFEGSTILRGASGPTINAIRIGVQPVCMDKRLTNNTMRLLGHKGVRAMMDVVEDVLDSYYRVTDGNTKYTIGESPGGVADQLVYGPTVHSVTEVYLETTVTTSRVTEHIQRWTNVHIGYSGATPGTTYTNLVGGIASFRYGRFHPGVWQDAANTVAATVASQGHSNYWWELRLSGDCYHAFYTQAVTGAAGNPAMDSDGASNKILYMRVIAAIRSDAGTSLTRTYTLTNPYALTEAIADDDTYVYWGIAGDVSRADA